VKHAFSAIVLLLVGLAWNNVWKWVPPQHGGRVFVAGSGLFIAFLLGAHALRSSRPVQVVAVLLIGFAAQVFGCNLWFILDPWVIKPGDELCSSRLGFPVGLVGLWVATMVLQYVYMRGDHERH
jgi:hypothetical protein